MKSILAVAVLCMVAVPAFSQQQLKMFDGADSNRQVHWCATPHLMASAEGQAALNRYAQARDDGTLPVARKVQDVFEIGQIASFNIQTDSSWIAAEFELRRTGNGWRAWLRSDASDQALVTNQRFDDFAAAMDAQTPIGSINPDKGVFENDFDIFGQPPIYPAGSDGIIDMLIYELDPGVAGFVHPSDYDPNAPDSIGNQSEIMYLDIDNFFVSGNGSMESVTAHELQHVIHINYDTREAQFVNEGQSEYAQQMNGYSVVPPFYLFGPLPEHNIGFFDWRGLSSADYQRASLWTGYVAERVGPEIVGLITQSNRVGLQGYEDAFATGGSSATFQELLADFHAANFINDRSIDPRFGYIDDQRTAELGNIQVPRFEGSEIAGIQTDSLDPLVVQPGGSFYLTLDNVSDVNVAIDVLASADQLQNRRSQMLVRVLARDLEGNWDLTEFNPSEIEHVIEGSFDRVHLILVHVRPESTPLRALFQVNWTDDPDRQVTVVNYATNDAAIRTIDGVPTLLAFLIDPQGRGAQATRFEPPPGSVLDRVTLATFYVNQFGNGGLPETDPRDLKLTIWASDGFGLPGEEIYSKILEDPQPYAPVTSTVYSWFDIDLDPAFGKNSQEMPDTIFVGMQNTGPDQNYLVLWPSNFNGSPAKETGFIRDELEGGDVGWFSLWDFARTPNLRPMNRTALPIQARFVIDNRPTAIETSGDIPDQVTLEQNYPNPFSPNGVGTQIRFALPEAQDVRIEVFDVTGRMVTRLLDGPQAPGSYVINVDASTWTSGMYFYRLTAGETNIVKRMVVLK